MRNSSKNTHTKTPNTSFLVFTNQVEAIRKRPKKVQKELVAAMIFYLAFGEEPDFVGMTLRNRQLAESMWMLMRPVLARSRRIRCAATPQGRNVGTGQFICAFDANLTHFHPLAEPPMLAESPRTMVRSSRKW